MTSNIHPTAIIDKGAQLGEGVSIGPYCVIGSEVKLGNYVTLLSHVVIDGDTTIGDNTQIFPFASIGHVTQDKKYGGEKTKLIIGKNNIIREHVTINPGTAGGGYVTSVGDDCLLMIACHVAHDCKVGNGVILANNVTLGGHVTVGNYAVIGGLSGIHQFVRIGDYAMIGGMSAIESDVIPYGLTRNERAYLGGLNLIGLKRRGFEREIIMKLMQVYEELFEAKDQGNFEERVLNAGKKYGNIKEIDHLIKFLQEDTSRSICKPKHAN
jgi:UDP-N-acetylglucosamine acyltransferase